MEVSFEAKSSRVLFTEDVEEQLNLLQELVPDWKILVYHIWYSMPHTMCGYY